MASGLLGVGLSGLLAAQRSLTVTGNNISNADAGVGTAIQSFFTAANQVSSDPSSQPARQVLLSQANNLADTFKYVGDRFAELGQQYNTELKDSVGQINALASGIAGLNQNIISAICAASGGLPNDLMDKRDATLTQLSKQLSVTAV